MIPRFKWRQIGEVNIFEFQGGLIEPWATRTNEKMNDMLLEHPAKSLLINLREMSKIDRAGAEALLENARIPSKKGILGRNLSSHFIAEQLSGGIQIPIFEKTDEAVFYFSHELAEVKEGRPFTRRRYPRIKTALPLEFELNNQERSFTFEGVVTNLSLGGLYAEFIDSITEEAAERVLDPLDFKLLSLHLELPQNETIQVDAKVLRVGEGEMTERGGIAFSFYCLSSESHRKIEGFVQREGVGGTEEDLT